MDIGKEIQQLQQLHCHSVTLESQSLNSLRTECLRLIAKMDDTEARLLILVRVRTE